MTDEQKKICKECGYNTNYGCDCPEGTEFYHCPLYENYYGNDLEKFNKEYKNK